MLSKVGILGGTFDPIHLGHLRTAVEIREGFGLDKVCLVPAAIPPHKRRTDMAAPEDRLEMARRATQDIPELQVSDVELKRRGPSYTIDTIETFRQKLTERVRIYLIMGVDAFVEIDTWKSYRALLRTVPVIIINRPGTGDQDQAALERSIEALVRKGVLEGYARSGSLRCYEHGTMQPVFAYHVTPLEISSTRIRELISEGRRIDYLVPSRVRDYIQTKGLYR